MRILEPHYFAAIKKRRQSHIFKKRQLQLLIGFLAVVSLYVLFGQGALTNLLASSDKPDPVAQRAAATLENKPKVLKKFSGQEFKSLYNSFGYPNTEPIRKEPEITGHAEIDTHIRSIAARRGYKLSSVPVASIVKTGEPGLEGDDLIQPNALYAWQQLKQAAAKNGIKLKLTSAYRSIDYQRALFLRRMKDAGVTIYTIAEGYADDELDTILTRAAPPGYSRHHTGYTIDLSCDGIGLEAFVRTSCYGWLSKNNFENAKTHGWVPSYPEGVTKQGPEPEAWEYIWVGTNSLYE